MPSPISSNPGVGPVSAPLPFVDVLASWAQQEQGINGYSGNFSHARLPISKTNSGSPLILQVLYVGKSFFDSDTPEISLYCVNEEGCSVQVRIKDVYHYFFYPAPDLIKMTDMISLRDHINDLLSDSSVDSPVNDIKIVERKIDINHEKCARFLQIFVHPNKMKSVQGSLKYRNLFTVPGASFDARLLYIWRFLFDHKIKPMGWIRIPANEYEVVSKQDKISRTQLEVLIDANVLSETTGPDLAPLRVFSFDIETHVPEDGLFPKADRHPVIQIGCVLSVYGASEQSIPLIRKIFTLKNCSPITGAQVHSCESEGELLSAWRQFFNEADPDIVTGHNILQFDIPFLLKRAESLQLDQFSDLGRTIGLCHDLPKERPNFYNCPDFEGRLILDMMHQISLWARNQGKEKTWYKLDEASSLFLEEKKEEMDYMQIPKLQAFGPDGRRKLAVYCLKASYDAYLPLQLMSKLRVLDKDSETKNLKAKAAAIPIHMMRFPPTKLDHLLSFVRDAVEAVEKGCIIPARAWNHWDKHERCTTMY